MTQSSSSDLVMGWQAESATLKQTIANVRTDKSSSRLKLRNIACAQGRTTVRLEPEFWNALHEISKREGLSINALFREIDDQRGTDGRTSASCVYILQYYRSAAHELGHAVAGHGSISERLGMFGNL